MSKEEVKKVSIISYLHNLKKIHLFSYSNNLTMVMVIYHQLKSIELLFSIIHNLVTIKKPLCEHIEKLILAEYDKNIHNDSIDYSFFSQNGFVELKEFEKIIQLLNKYDKISKIFEELDTNDDHRIGYNEFKKGFELLGEDTSDEDHLQQEFDSIDSNHGGYILFDEVKSFYNFNN